MKALFVSSQFPFDSREEASARFQRMHAFLEAVGAIASEIDVLMLVSQRHAAIPQATRLERSIRERVHIPVALTVATSISDPSDPQYHARRRLARLRSLIDPFSGSWNGSLLRADPAHLSALKDRLSRKPDIIFVHKLLAMATLLQTDEKSPRAFFDMDDVEHWKALRMAVRHRHWRSKAAHLIDALSLLRVERRAVQMSRRVYVCSEADMTYMVRTCRSSNIACAPNSARLPANAQAPDRMTALFLGALDYAPNQMAADHLIGNIWPRVRARLPSATLTIAGPYPDRLRSFRAGVPGVTYLGFVEDLDRLYAETRIVCCPIRVGGGTRVKIIEAAAHGKAVVSTRVGAEGLAFRDGEEIVIRDSTQAFASVCIELLQDPALCHRIGTAARAAAARVYDRRRIIEDIAKDMARVVGESAWP